MLPRGDGIDDIAAYGVDWADADDDRPCISLLTGLKARGLSFLRAATCYPPRAFNVTAQAAHFIFIFVRCVLSLEGESHKITRAALTRALQRYCRQR